MKIPTTTQFELNEVTAVLVAHNRRARYGVADYKRMIWQASKAGCPVIAALAARMLMVRMSAPVEILKERFIFTIKGKPDYAFTTAMVAYVEYLVARPDNINDPRIQKLAKALHSDAVRQFILTRYKGQIVPGF